MGKIFTLVLMLVAFAVFTPTSEVAAKATMILTDDDPPTVDVYVDDNDEPVFCQFVIFDYEPEPSGTYTLGFEIGENIGGFAIPADAGNVYMDITCGDATGFLNLVYDGPPQMFYGWLVTVNKIVTAVGGGITPTTPVTNSSVPTQHGLQCDLGTAKIFYTTDGGISVYRAETPDVAALEIKLDQLSELAPSPAEYVTLGENVEVKPHIVVFQLTTGEFQVNVGPDPRDGKLQSCIWDPEIDGSSYTRYQFDR